MKVTIINTHSGENPQFVNPIIAFIEDLGYQPNVINGLGSTPPLEGRIILSGVPMDATYSLSHAETQAVVEAAFGWLRSYTDPVLGICYGLQILAHIFGGKVSPMDGMICDARFPLSLARVQEKGIFKGIHQIEVFAEHRDYVSKVPEDFVELSRKHGVPYIIYHPERQFYGVQFVPELSDIGTKNCLKRFINAQFMT